jgi:muramoyltetrapeptide carboxypeptidase
MDTTRLLPGTTIAIVAPGGYAPDDIAFNRALERLTGFGCKLRNYYQSDAKFLRFGATDAGRLAQLHAAAADPEVQVVMALRGGYGMSRLLPQIDLDALAQSGKLFVGHSDFTALQMALLAHSGACSFAGPMVCDDLAREDLSEFTLGHFERCVTGPQHVIEFAATDSPVLDESGVLWGGNLTMLTHLVGTPYFPKVRDGILFIEDVNEHPYRVERMLLQLQLAGLLEQKAIVFGDFSNYRLSPYDNGYDFGPMLEYLRAEIKAPIITGLPFGHIRDKATLVVGSATRLQCDGTTATFTMNGYPSLSGARG